MHRLGHFAFLSQRVPPIEAAQISNALAFSNSWTLSIQQLISWCGDSLYKSQPCQHKPHLRGSEQGLCVNHYVCLRHAPHGNSTPESILRKRWEHVEPIFLGKRTFTLVELDRLLWGDNCNNCRSDGKIAVGRCQSIAATVSCRTWLDIWVLQEEDLVWTIVTASSLATFTQTSLSLLRLCGSSDGNMSCEKLGTTNRGPWWCNSGMISMFTLLISVWFFKARDLRAPGWTQNSPKVTGSHRSETVTDRSDSKNPDFLKSKSIGQVYCLQISWRKIFYVSCIAAVMLDAVPQLKRICTAFMSPSCRRVWALQSRQVVSIRYQPTWRFSTSSAINISSLGKKYYLQCPWLLSSSSLLYWWLRWQNLVQKANAGQETAETQFLPRNFKVTRLVRSFSNFHHFSMKLQAFARDCWALSTMQVLHLEQL